MTPAEQIALLEEVQAQIAEEIARLQQPVKWEPEGGNWTIEPTDVHLSYPSRGAAEAVIPQLRTYTRLLAYVQEFETSSVKDRIIAYTVNGFWQPIKLTREKITYPDTIYMSADCAKTLCDKLNSGEVTL
jgi:hypothetical protein